MSKKSNFAKSSIVAGSIVCAAMFSGNVLKADDAKLFSYDNLGSGSQVRTELLYSGGSLEFDAKCGEGKCGEGKCGGKKETEKEENKKGKNEKSEKSEKSEEKEQEGKSKEAKCGEGKCGN